MLYRPSMKELQSNAAKVSKSPFVFLGCAVMMGVVGGYIGCMLNVVPGCSPRMQTNAIRLFGGVFAYYFFASNILGFLMHHYFVDRSSGDSAKTRSCVRICN